MTWRDDVIDALTSQLRDRGPERTNKELGNARPTEEPGWYHVSTRNNPIQLDRLTELRLLHEDGSEYRVIDHSESPESEFVAVRVGRHAPKRGLTLWGTTRPTDFLERSQLEALRDLKDVGGLAEKLAVGRVDPLPETVPDSGWFTGEQARALAACLTDGLHFVWGLPGAGKTTILGKAINDLVHDGLRVLLVSGTNVAVDNAVAAVLQDLDGPQQGELLRVGTPQLREIKSDDRVVLDRIVEARIRELIEERDAVEEELVRLLNDPTLARLKDLEEKLAKYEPDTYQSAKRRVDRKQRIDDFERKLDEFVTESRRLQHDLASRQDTLSTEQEKYKPIAGAEEKRSEANRLRLNLRALIQNVKLREAEFDRALADRRKSAKTRDQRRIAAAQKTLEKALDEKYKAQDKLKDQRVDLQTRISECESLAASFPPELIAQARRRLEEAEAAIREHEEAIDGIEQRIEQTEQELNAEKERDRPTAEDHELVKFADRDGLPTLYAEREEVRRQATNIRARCTQLAKQHDELVVRLTTERAKAETEIIYRARLVATTLSRVHLKRAVAEGHYDVVLVDEAAAASIPEVLLAVALAKKTATLFGDFYQLGPVSRNGLEHDRWLRGNCFELAGIVDGETAHREPGCVALLETHRFGQPLQRLANSIAYDGWLQVASGRLAAGPDTEVVLITTDDLGEWGLSRTSPRSNGRWWEAGSVLTHAIAMHHVDQGDSVGVITPYTLQKQATQSYLRDKGDATAHVEVGTTHSFQSREFDVVIFDTVEDGGYRGWIARGNMRSKEQYARDGARVFNVGATRAKRRLYLLCSWKSVRNAESGTALHAVRSMINKGVKGIRAGEFLGLSAEERRPAIDPIEEDVWSAFDKHIHVVVDGWFDENTYFREVLDDIDKARGSIWMWSPFVEQRVYDFLGHLRDASHNRDIPVHVFVTDPDDSFFKPNERADKDTKKRAALREQMVARLTGAVTYLVRVRAEHKKIVIIDRETTYLGSLNSLSSSRNLPSREIMLRHRGNRYAEHILENTFAENLIPPRQCVECSVQMEAGPWRDGKWAWICPKQPEHKNPI